MPGVEEERFVPAAEAVRGFSHFTDDDVRLALENASQRTFVRGEVILKEGSREQGLFVLRKGAVLVERLHEGRRIAFARMTAGSVFGEMSFLEATEASASVVADETTEVTVIGGNRLLALTESIPGFGTRLYRSLAVLLARRLRERTELLPPLLVEEVPQVTRFHAGRASVADEDQVPVEMIDSVETFKSELLTADRALKDGKLGESEAQDQVSGACTLVHDELGACISRYPERQQQIGSYVFRETFPLFMQSPFIDRSFSKPRGYAGDYATIDMIYEHRPAGAGRIGPLIDDWALDQKTPRAVRNRRVLMAQTIGRVRGDFSGCVLMTSIASGPAREVFDFFERDAEGDAHATCIDIDPEALAYTAGRAEELGLTERFTFARENVIRLLRGRGDTQIGAQHLIYSLGLTDYLADRLVVQLLNWMHDHLVPGGIAAFGNNEVSNPDRPYMDHILEWGMIYRTAADMERLFRQSQFRAAPVDIKPEAEGVQLFAFARHE